LTKERGGEERERLPKEEAMNRLERRIKRRSGGDRESDLIDLRLPSEKRRRMVASSQANGLRCAAVMLFSLVPSGAATTIYKFSVSGSH
jgi:hypothetical protein